MGHEGGKLGAEGRRRRTRVAASTRTSSGSSGGSSSGSSSLLAVPSHPLPCSFCRLLVPPSPPTAFSPTEGLSLPLSSYLPPSHSLPSRNLPSPSLLPSFYPLSPPTACLLPLDAFCSLLPPYWVSLAPYWAATPADPPLPRLLPTASPASCIKGPQRPLPSPSPPPTAPLAAYCPPSRSLLGFSRCLLSFSCLLLGAH